jgi:selenide, water dikinase
LRAGARCATDVTGFGLIGHLYKLALASGVAVELDVERLPILPGVQQLAEEGLFPGGSNRNLEFAGHRVKSADRGRWDAWKMLLADPQTSGGLLFSCDPDAAVDAVAGLQANGHAAAVVGNIVIGAPGEIRI